MQPAPVLCCPNVVVTVHRRQGLSGPTTIGNLIDEQLSADMREFLHTAGESAASEGFRLFLVGGMVRDLLLNRPSRDLDLLVQSANPSMNDAPALASMLAMDLGGKVASVSQFGTANLRVSGFETDLATARKETYAFSGALPDVIPATIEEDLTRRDFTVNTLAADLAPIAFGALLDLHRGVDDLQQGMLRVLHDRSFQDDPTRLLRAARYETRLGLRMTPETEAAARRDAEHLKQVSGDRIWHELERIFDEDQPEIALARADNLVLFQTLVPTLEWAPELSRAVQSIREAGHVTTPLLYLALLSIPLTKGNSEALVARLRVPAPWAEVIRDMHTLRVRLPSLGVDNMLPSAVYARLSGLTTECILGWSALAPEQATRGLLLSFLMKWQLVKPHLTGDDLLKLGVHQGPKIGELLQELLNARLDDVVVTRGDEEALVKERLAG